jgi:predicted nucleic acid-binding Zn ribbon protein
MADQVKCLYCGKKISANISHCSHCGAVSHYQEKGYRVGARKNFLVWFVLLVILCAVMILWLPR